jgi:hypothetical protein
MRRLLYRSFRATFAINQWLRRRFTKAGLLLLAGIFISAIVGIDTYLTMTYQIFTLLVCILAVSICWSFFFFPNISIRRVLPRYATANEIFTYRIQVNNHTGIPQRSLCLFENFATTLPSFEALLQASEPDEQHRNRFDRFVGYHRWQYLIATSQACIIKPLAIAALAPHEKVEMLAEIMPSQRGILQFDSVFHRLSRSFRFGVCRENHTPGSIHSRSSQTLSPWAVHAFRQQKISDGGRRPGLIGRGCPRVHRAKRLPTGRLSAENSLEKLGQGPASR